ncbi:ROK family protein [Ectobacillus sp. JY-23]|uniref:ROK family protein n=1 Tax=Ectobacillus sp. JY-23 TaxID=2933872 RepID=UPI001FF5C774|nr:ROK family protein [Ectobacillus sp. JY-23]UOY92242.1 ROK family protein [Ectobacillus sp. JY-23]
METFVVFDIGGTAIKHALMTKEGNILEEGSVPTPGQGNGETIPLLASIIEAYKEKSPVSGIAMSVPGAIEVKSGYVYFMGAVTDLQHINIKHVLEERTGLPVEADNDVNCVALAEKWKGNAQDCENFVCVTVGTGIGGGIFINGDLYRGKHSMAGEFGLMTLHAEGELAQLVQTHSFSQSASTRSLIDNVANKYPDADGKRVFELAAQGDEAALAAIDKFYTFLAIGLHNIVYSLAPEKILLGGAISAREDFASRIRMNMKEIRPETAELTEIDVCQFRNQAGKIGALYHFLKMRQLL